MDIKPIKSEEDYEQALARIDVLMEAESDSPEGDELDVLATLVEAYETRHYPIEKPDPIEALLFRMEQGGLTRKDLEPLIGNRGRISEILTGRRPLTLAMIRRLHAQLGIPADVLIQEPEKELA